MTSVDTEQERAAAMPRDGATAMKLEVVILPVSDVDRARRFYERLGWTVDADFSAGDDVRVVELTPPASPTSIILGTGITTAAPGSVRELQLVVDDIEAAHADLVARGIDVSEVFHDARGAFHRAGTEGRVSGPDPERRSYASFASFSDPDGNGWVLQEVTVRLPGRAARTAFDTAGELTAALRRAAIAHGKHEQRIGAADPNWPDWYAEYMVREQAGQELPA